MPIYLLPQLRGYYALRLPPEIDAPRLPAALPLGGFAPVAGEVVVILTEHGAN